MTRSLRSWSYITRAASSQLLPDRLTNPSKYLHTRMVPPNTPSAVPPNPLTTEQFMDLLSSKSPSELSALRHLSVKAYPFPLWPSDSSSYTTYDLQDLLPLFPELALEELEVEDSYHGPDVMEDGWGHNATYQDLGAMIKKSKAWKELVYHVQSDRWLEEVVFKTSGPGQESKDVVHGRDPQPETWDKMIKERDGEESGAVVEMWCKKAGNGNDWKKIVSDYRLEKVEEHEGEADYDEDNMGTRPAIKIRVRRGDRVEYKQDGENHVNGSYGKHLQVLYKTFEERPWVEIKEEELFMKGAEADPTAHL